MLPVFFINLASRPDRLQYMERQLAALSIEATRVEAVTPADFSREPKARRGSDETYLNAGEIACSRSHRNIWQSMVERDVPAALILEDDVVLSRNVPHLLGDLEQLAKSVDAIQLETRGTVALVGRPVATSSAGVTINRLMSSCYGTAAYIMTNNLARKLLQRSDLDTLSVDNLLFGRPGGLFYAARMFQLLPAQAVQLDRTAEERTRLAQSDLHSHRPASPGRPTTLRGKLRRVANHWGHHMRVVSTFAPSGEIWGSRNLRLPVAEDLRALL